ncbi:MAG: replicative DNA helicase [Nitrospirales bacterium]|nr:replicative DNA helicase [Nitrospirales bacterium]
MSGVMAPFDKVAERAVIAAVICEDSALIQVRPILNASDFFFEKCRIVYGACLRLQDKNISRDLLTVNAELRQSNELETVGGSAFLAELAGEFISLANLIHHAEIVKKFSKRRMLVKRTQKFYQQVQDSEEPEALVGEFYTQAIQDLSMDQAGFLTMPEVMHKFLDTLDQRKRGEVLNGWPTGLASLDSRIGGWKPGHLNVIAARPSMGKTSLACLTALVGAKAGAKVGIFSLEMGAEELAQRIVCLNNDNLTMKALSNGNLTSCGWTELVSVSEGLSQLPIKVCDSTNLTLEKTRSMASLLKIRGELDVLILDYLQLIALDERGLSRQEATAGASRKLKILAKDLDISVIVLSQLNRQCEGREDKRPHLADLRESGAIEQDADVVVMLYRDEFYNQESAYKGQAEILIRKQRNGPTGEILVNWVGTNAALKDQG